MDEMCEDCGRIDARDNECSTGPCGHHTLEWEMGVKP